MTEQTSSPPLPRGATAPWGEERQCIIARGLFLVDRVAVVESRLAGAQDVDWASTAAASFRALIEDVEADVAQLSVDIADLEEAATWLCTAGQEAESSLDALAAANAAGAGS